MKLKHFERHAGYYFLLTFENGDVKEADLAELIARYVSLDALMTARIDPEWGCLEFNGGNVDIEPKTLYQFVTAVQHKEVA